MCKYLLRQGIIQISTKQMLKLVCSKKKSQTYIEPWRLRNMKLLEQNGMHFVKCYSVLYHYIYSGKSLEKPVAFYMGQFH